MHNHQEPVIVITGATSGFGKGAALKFAEEGANLVLAARRKQLLKDVARSCEESGAEALTVETDVSDFGDVRRLARQTIRHFGRIDIWVNNAGAATFGHYDEIPIKEHEQVIATNLLGAMYGIHLALRQFRKQGYGTLINLGSFEGKSSAPYQSSYVASKHGLLGLGTAIRQELKANGDNDIHVCTIMPTSMDTPFFQHAANHMGRPVAPISPVYPAEQAIDAIVRAAHDPEQMKDVVVGRTAKIAAATGKLAPFGFEKMMTAKKMHKSHMEQDESVPDTTGNLFKPVSNEGGIHGGWLEQKQQNKSSKIGLVAALAIALPVALSAIIMRRSRAEGKRNIGAAA